MLIDLHTHIFPDKIAARAVSSLAAACHIPPYTDGTEAGLLAALARAGGGIAVNLPVLTSPQQTDSVFAFCQALNARFGGEGILSFAGAHPEDGNIRAALRRVKEAGFLGIKIHPEYQSSFLDSDETYRLLAAAKDEELITVVHAGVDGAYRAKEVRATPSRAARVLARLGGYPKLVLAHLGGNEMLNEVMVHLAGKDLYLDTAYVLPTTDGEAFSRLLAAHGEERILFASDSPWQDVATCRRRLASYRLAAATEENIAWKNAARLLGLSPTTP